MMRSMKRTERETKTMTTTAAHERSFKEHRCPAKVRRKEERSWKIIIIIAHIFTILIRWL